MESFNNQPESPGFEMLSEQLHTESNPQRVELFFSLAMESFETPGVEKQYETEIRSSESKKLDSSSLEAQLKKVERSVETPILGLKGRRPLSIKEQPSTDTEEDITTRLPIPPAPTTLRIAAGTVDALVIILISLGATAFIFGDLPEGVSTIVSPAMIPLYATAFEILLASTIMYPLLALLIFGNTAGCSVLGLSVVSPDGTPIRLTSLIVRSISLPLSTAIFGFLPLIWGARPLHDLVSASTVYAGQPLVFET
jgi:uncharacterized RDD family membrane protein YckC